MSGTERSLCSRPRVLELTDRHVLTRMVVFDAVRDAEAGRRAEIAALEDNALRENDARIRLGAGDGIPDRAAFDLDVLAALHARLDAVEREIVGRGGRSMHLRPGPAHHRPRSSHLAPEKHLDRRALGGSCALIDQNDGLAVALVDRAGPVRVDREAQTVQLDVAGRALFDMPRPTSFAFAGRRSRIEVARTAPVAVARDEDVSVEVPAVCHVHASGSWGG